MYPIFIILICVSAVNCNFATDNSTSAYMKKEERESLKQEALEMFYHAYNSYMIYAYPADELMPLSCSGRYRGSHQSRGNVDETLGNFSLTLIDSLDTLVILGNLTEFERAVKLVIQDVNFDKDVLISVFETNIRVLGGLLSAHILADHFKIKSIGYFDWYNDELLELAKDLGYRLLPAFNTTTGIPYGRINLKRGITRDYYDWCCDTCTACAGTMILEMAALSRLTGIPVFEEKAHKAMDELWNMRHRTSNLMGTVLNVHSGDWIRKDAGVGAGIDSYYEYCLKAYILLADDKYLRRFNTHYSAIMTYISQGPMLLDVHMHKPELNSRNFMDALLAFWPGLQVLKGDLKPAIETHEMLYQVMQKHKFIPEAFTTDFQVHWAQHPLRPEFIESTYFLYRATGDHHYLRVGRSVLRALQGYARVKCGFASVSDVRTGIHEDSMDSFVLAETFKYLYLLFADPNELLINLDDFIFTTEAHLLPLSISRKSVTHPYINLANNLELDKASVNENDSKSCSLNKEEVITARRNVKSMVDNACPSQTQSFARRLLATEFQVNNEKHLQLLKNMGIKVAALHDGRMQLHHSFMNAASQVDADEGVLFMHEMIQLSKVHFQENNAQAVSFVEDSKKMSLTAGPAHFGRILHNDDTVTSVVSVVDPLKACEAIKNSESVKNKIAIVERGDCMFIDKARKVQEAGAVAGIIVDNVPDSYADGWPLFAMSGDGTENDINIPFVFLFTQEAKQLISAVSQNPNLYITLSEKKEVKTKPNLYNSNNHFQKIKRTVRGELRITDADPEIQRKLAILDSLEPVVKLTPEEREIHIHTEKFMQKITVEKAPSIIKLNKFEKNTQDGSSSNFGYVEPKNAKKDNTVISNSYKDDKYKHMARNILDYKTDDSDMFDTKNYKKPLSEIPFPEVWSYDRTTADNIQKSSQSDPQVFTQTLNYNIFEESILRNANKKHNNDYVNIDIDYEDNKNSRDEL